MNTCSYCHQPFRATPALLYCCYGCKISGKNVAAKKKLFQWKWFFGSIASTGLFIHYFLSAWFFRSSFDLPLELALGLIVVGAMALPAIGNTLFFIRNRRLMAAEPTLALAVVIDCGYSFYLLLGTLILGGEMEPGYFPFLASAVVLPLWHLASLIEGKARFTTHEPYAQMLAMRETCAIKIVKNQEIVCKVSELLVGDVIRVKPGEKIPCDGVLVSGTTSVDESAMTAERTILLKQKGETVTGASINRDGTILIRIEKNISEHYLERMIGLVSQSLQAQFKPQVLFEKNYPLYVLGVVLLSGGSFFQGSQLGLNEGLSRALAVLLASSIGMLARSLPSLITLGIAGMARKGILVRSANVFSVLSRVDHLFFDKTGTLTKGEFTYSQFYQEVGVNQGAILSMVFSLENQSSHPLAHGVESHPNYHEIPVYKVRDFKTEPGLGISGVVALPGHESGLFAAVGNQRYLKRLQMQISRAMREKIEQLEAMGDTVVLCGWQGQVRGVLSFSDILRSDVNALLARLNVLGLKPVMITGDHDEMMGHLAFTHGLEQIYTRCLPDEKIRKMKARQDKGGVVGYVGNPMDMGEVIKKADVGILINAGTVTALDSADVIIPGKRLLTVPDLIAYSRGIYSRTRLPIFLAIGQTGLAFAFSMTGLLPPAFAAIQMVLTTVFFNAFPLSLKKIFSKALDGPPSHRHEIAIVKAA